MSKFHNNYNRLVGQVDVWLKAQVQELSAVEEVAEACSYAVLSGGKRVRPVLSLAVAELLAVEPALLRELAVAVELIHTASLIHDDLPALDDDDERRGQPTVHKRFGESTAILAGDLLIAKSCSLIAGAEEVPAEVRLGWVKQLADATATLCDGQALDLKVTGAKSVISDISQMRDSEFIVVNRMKTGALFNVAITAPWSLYSGKSRSNIKTALEVYADNLGLLFQVTDDLLDFTGPGETSSLVGPDHLQSPELLCENAISALEQWGEKGWFLKSFAEQVRDRKS